jgi:sugar lactone lactonase YvrE
MCGIIEVNAARLCRALAWRQGSFTPPHLADPFSVPDLRMISLSVSPVALESAGYADLGEGPLWDDRLARLYWVDITSGRVHWLNAGSGQREKIQMEQTVSFVALTNDPSRVVVGLGSGLAFLDLRTRREEKFAQLESESAKLRCNDGKCDPTGRIWAGTMQWGGNSDRGSLTMVGPNLQGVRRLTDLRIANGLAWSAERREMYFIDSPSRRIDRFDWDAASGAITPKEALAVFEPADGTPDGMTIDRNGNLWVAFWNGACVRQIDGGSGEILARIDLPVAQVTSCVFGGRDFSTLFITTAANGLSAEQRAQQPLAGALFAACPGARGLAADRFVWSPPKKATDAAVADLRSD